MLLKLRKIGNSYGVILPKDVVGPFLEAGAINVEIQGVELPKKNAGIPIPSGITDQMAGEKIAVLPSAVEEEMTVVIEEEIPDEYKLKPGYGPKKF